MLGLWCQEDRSTGACCDVEEIYEQRKIQKRWCYHSLRVNTILSLNQTEAMKVWLFADFYCVLIFNNSENNFIIQFERLPLAAG